MWFQSKPVTRWKSAKGVRSYTMYYLTFTSSARGFPYTSQLGNRLKNSLLQVGVLEEHWTKSSTLGSTSILCVLGSVT